MLFKIRKAIRSDKFEKCLFIFGLLFMFYGIIRIFINPPIQELIIFIIFFILIITLIMLNCLEKIKREVFDEDIDKRFLKILNSARMHSKYIHEKELNIIIIISSQELLNTFILGIERSIYSYDEFIFIQKSLLNIASILREKDNEWKRKRNS